MSMTVMVVSSRHLPVVLRLSSNRPGVPLSYSRPLPCLLWILEVKLQTAMRNTGLSTSTSPNQISTYSKSYLTQNNMANMIVVLLI